MSATAKGVAADGAVTCRPERKDGVEGRGVEGAVGKEEGAEEGKEGGTEEGKEEGTDAEVAADRPPRAVVVAVTVVTESLAARVNA